MPESRGYTPESARSPETRSVDFFVFADAIDKTLVIKRTPGSDDFTAQFEDAEVKEGGVLGSRFGIGRTPQRALSEYAKNIQGQTLVFDAMNRSARREFRAPDRLKFT